MQANERRGFPFAIRRQELQFRELVGSFYATVCEGRQVPNLGVRVFGRLQRVGELSLCLLDLERGPVLPDESADLLIVSRGQRLFGEPQFPASLYRRS